MDKKQFNKVLAAAVAIPAVVVPFSSVADVEAEEVVTEIHTVEDLNDIRADRTGSYKLMADINLEGQSWRPFPFEGQLDGNGYEIQNIFTEDTSRDNMGLFTLVRNGAQVKDLILKNPVVIGDNYVGALAGKVSGAVVERVDVIMGEVTGTSYVGGVIGQTDTSDVVGISSSANVEGDREVGGLIGELGRISTLENGLATGDVRSEVNTVGGAVGRTYSKTTMNNVIATGDVQGPFGTAMGGVVGYQLFGDITNVYAFNSNIAEHDLVIGGRSKGTSSNLYKLETLGGNISVEQMKEEGTYETFSFGDVWKMGDNHAELLAKGEVYASGGSESGTGSDDGTTGEVELQSWSFDNEDSPFVGVVPHATVFGGKSFDGITLNNVEWNHEGPFDTGYGDVYLEVDGNGNTLVSAPDGLGDSETEQTIELKHNGVHFLTIDVKPVPVLNFNF